MIQSGTKQKILKIGRSLLQQHGYHGFSFQHIADELKIKKPSLYDHYGSKEELLQAILKDYSESFDQWSQAIEPLPVLEKIQKVFEVFYHFSSDRRKVCPILALSIDFQGLPKGVQRSIQVFLDKWLQWLEKQIALGQKQGVLRKGLKASDLAAFVYSQVMGAQFQARVQNEPQFALRSGRMIVKLIEIEQ